jgi:hypothetical protein
MISKANLASLGLVLAVLGSSPSWASPAHVEANLGVVTYVSSEGDRVKVVGRWGQDPVLSPDGQHVAFVGIHATKRGGSALWIYDIPSKALKRLLVSHPTENNETNLRDLNTPVFSLRGDQIYIQSAAWVTSGTVFRVGAKTGEHHFVSPANSLVIVRDGPYAGDLVVSQHAYNSGPDGGSFEQLSLLRPDGQVILKIPGSDTDTDDLRPWLVRNGWQAW